MAGERLEDWFRYQDFHVNEIGVDGNEVHLLELWTKVAIGNELKQQSEDTRNFLEQLGPSYVLSEDQEAALHLLGKEDRFRLLEFLREPLEGRQVISPVILTLQ